ncbi:MAG: hypothetical protein KC731_41875, partial [Myxococcales bacterium]|nr:hypothetical protein [Myxococcales bacterium]
TFVSQLGRAHRSTLASLRDLAVLDLAGAEIKNALLSAAYESDRLGKKEIDLPTVLDGIQMELAKSGRGLSSRELKRLQEVGS